MRDGIQMLTYKALPKIMRWRP